MNVLYLYSRVGEIMKETLIYKLNKHNIYYISTPSYGFYILVPFTDYTDTNIVLRLKGNYQSYDLNKNSLALTHLLT